MKTDHTPMELESFANKQKITTKQTSPLSPHNNKPLQHGCCFSINNKPLQHGHFFCFAKKQRRRFMTSTEQATKKKAAPAVSRRGAARDFTSDECCNFLRVALAIRPVGSREWQQVAEEHGKHPEYGAYLRDGRSLQRKYQALCRTKTPSGDPDLPQHLSLAFDVKQAICDRTLIATGYEEMNLNGSNVDGDGDGDGDGDDDESSVMGDQGQVEVEGEKEEEEQQGQQQQEQQQQTVTKKTVKATKKTSPPVASVTSATFAPPNVARRGPSPSPMGDFLQFAMLQMQADRERREQDYEEARRQQNDQRNDQRRHEELRAEEQRRRDETRREERIEEARIRREERDEDRRRQEQMVNLLLMTATAYFRGKSSNDSNNTNNPN
jgi:hypothetical protein